MRNVLLIVLIGLIGWDIMTTYYGTLSIFSEGQTGVFNRIFSTDFFIHLVSLVFAIGLIVFILAYRIILNSENKITFAILVVAFLYDFGTSFYGTSQAVGLDSGDGNPFQYAIIFLLAIMCTASPLLIGQIYDDSAE